MRDAHGSTHTSSNPSVGDASGNTENPVPYSGTFPTNTIPGAPPKTSFPSTLTVTGGYA